MIVLFEMHPIVSGTYRLATHFLSFLSTYYIPLMGLWNASALMGRGSERETGRNRDGRGGGGVMESG